MKRKIFKIISISIVFNTIIIFFFLTPLYSSEPEIEGIYICADKEGSRTVWITDKPLNATSSKYKYQCVHNSLYKWYTSKNQGKQNKVTVTETQEASNVLTAEAWLNKANKLWKGGKCTNPQKAIEYLTNAIKLKPDYADAYNDRGIAYFLQGNKDLGCHDAHKACTALRDCELLEAAIDKGYCH